MPRSFESGPRESDEEVIELKDPNKKDQADKPGELELTKTKDKKPGKRMTLEEQQEVERSWK